MGSLEGEMLLVGLFDGEGVATPMGAFDILGLDVVVIPYSFSEVNKLS